MALNNVVNSLVASIVEGLNYIPEGSLGVVETSGGKDQVVN